MVPDILSRFGIPDRIHTLRTKIGGIHGLMLKSSSSFNEFQVVPLGIFCVYDLLFSLWQAPEFLLVHIVCMAQLSLCTPACSYIVAPSQGKDWMSKVGTAQQPHSPNTATLSPHSLSVGNPDPSLSVCR